MSVLVEFSDHVVVIEAPQDDAKSEATIAAVRRMMPYFERILRNPFTPEGVEPFAAVLKAAGQ